LKAVDEHVISCFHRLSSLICIDVST